MTSFSKRHGIVKESVIQIDSMNDDLRNSLRNLFASLIKSTTDYTSPWYELLKSVYIRFFKKPVDEVQYDDFYCREFMLKFFKSSKWNEIYDFYEEIIQNWTVYDESFKNIGKEQFMNFANNVLVRDNSGYRFINDLIVPITNEMELQEIEETLKSSEGNKYDGIQLHIKNALELLGKKPKPDYRNSIKESISAVESICKQISGVKSGGLDDPLKKINEKIYLHPAMTQGFLKLYGYTSDEDGIRHPILEDGKKIGYAEAKYMLVTCSAFVNFLIDKCKDVKPD